MNDFVTLPGGRAVIDRYQEPITTKADLVKALHDACELEHELMCLYLYAAYSLKRDPDDTCTPAEFEFVRRWALHMLAVARQEMEHLHLANSLLTAIGEAPHFDHGPIPSLSPFMTAESRFLHLLDEPSDAEQLGQEAPTPRDLPFYLRPFSLDTIQMFICVESPAWKDFQSAADRPMFCFTCEEQRAESYSATAAAPPGEPRLPVRQPHLRPGPTPQAAPGELLSAPSQGEGLSAPSEPIHAGSVRALYNKIRDAFHALPDLFPPGHSRQVDIIDQYQVSVLPVKDVESADAAIDLIMRQGEGFEGSSALQSHYKFFSDIRDEYLRLSEEAKRQGRSFQPARDLLNDPTSGAIQVELTRKAFELADYCYATLVHMLQALYTAFIPQNDESYPYFASTLHELAYSPFMTMVLRVWSDVLALLPVEQGKPMGTGMSYALSPEDGRLLRAAAENFRTSPLANISFFCDRFRFIRDELAKLLPKVEGATYLSAPAKRAVLRQLTYMHQNAQRMTDNLVSVYQSGRFPQFLP